MKTDFILCTEGFEGRTEKAMDECIVLLNVSDLEKKRCKTNIMTFYSVLMVGVWMLDYIWSSLIVKLDSGQDRVEIYNRRGSQVVEGPHANHH